MSFPTLFRITASLGVALLSGTYYFVLLRGTCDHTPWSECILDGPRVPTKKVTEPRERPQETITRGQNFSGKGTQAQSAPPTVSGVRWAQTSATELLLIWSGHLDGEVGRVAPGDFDKAVKAYQATLLPAATTEEQQISVLRKMVDGRRSQWGFDKEDDPNAAELSVPHKLLGSGRQLAYGTQYQSSSGDFVVDVAERIAGEGMFDRIRQNHCCKPPREREGEIIDTTDTAGPGFMLNAREGKLRVSVRAQQRDGVIRILAIAYETMGKDKEYRILRNAIASSYAAFTPARKREERVYDACQRSDGERCGAEKTPTQPAQWGHNGNAPL